MNANVSSLNRLGGVIVMVYPLTVQVGAPLNPLNPTEQSSGGDDIIVNFKINYK